ncbi:MAG: bifunctional [glutamine synthetase] adenylyltransferase/[glutamine synthetase]-adenylyl-L-tyrosine phosphorylase [Hyphomicrobiales bacterium]
MQASWQILSKQDDSLTSLLADIADPKPVPTEIEADLKAAFERLDTHVQSFLSLVAQHAPHLRQLMIQDAARLHLLCNSGFDEFLLGATRRLHEDLAETHDDIAAMAALRRYKQSTALSIALWDLGDVLPQKAVLEALSKAAEISVEQGLRYLVTQEAASGKCTYNLPNSGLDGLGFVLLGMGKLGGWELNYSSDIDLIALYDPDGGTLADGQEPSVFWVRLVKRLVRLMQERTGDGYAYRMDLRLRPDPGSTPLAVSVPGALQYYEGTGQNWERAALIKARPIAGDIPVGDQFLADIIPFIWRRYLDYAALEDIHAIKRQIHAHKGFVDIRSASHNIKLGRGGIREIEFFVQTQQLIAGGRNPRLRNRKTLKGLNALMEIGWVEKPVLEDLSSAYEYLRQVENRIQMMDDEQTHIVPEDDGKRHALSVLSGAATLASFDEKLIKTFQTVQRHYAELFEENSGSDTVAGNLVFTGDADDPATLETLSNMGFQQPSLAVSTISGWHFGRIAATQSEHARAVLTGLVPSLLQQFSQNGQPDQALAGFDKFISGLPAGLQLFSLLKSNPELLSLLSLVLGAAPRLANTITRRPHVLDALLDPGFFGAVFTVEDMTAHLQQTLAQARGFEDALDRARIFSQEQMFLIGARILTGTLNAKKAALAYTALAEAVVNEMLRVTQEDFAVRHGKVSDARMCILAMGKLGSREMTATSDLDLMLIYDFDDANAQSDGVKPLPVSQYFMRLTQRLITALSAPTGEGLLYEIDMRLRPSGNAGPLATQLESFVSYQQSDAWTWERMALTRARPISGDDGLCNTLRKAVLTAIQQQASNTLKADAADMLAKIHEVKQPTHIWDVKTSPGGVVDIEFVAQVLQLQHAQTYPDVLQGHTRKALRIAVEQGLLPSNEGDILIAAHRTYEAIQQIVRMAFDGGESKLDFLEQRGFAPILNKTCELPDVETIEAELKSMQTEVVEIVDAFFSA